MSRNLLLGTTEFLKVLVEDADQSITDLAGLNPVYDVLDEGDTPKYTGAAPFTVGMYAYCLIDTNGWDIGAYRLYLTFNNAPEIPKLGPFRFRVGNE